MIWVDVEQELGIISVRLNVLSWLNVLRWLLETVLYGGSSGYVLCVLWLCMRVFRVILLFVSLGELELMCLKL